MDILIKNMEMPKSCEGCPLCFLSSDGRNFFCTRQIGKRFDLSLSDQRQEDCPLVPIPEHGDLIDKDFLLKYAIRLERKDGCDLVPISSIEAFPVVLERTT